MNISSSGAHVLLISSLWLAFLSMMFLITLSFKLYWTPIYPPFIFMVTAFCVLFKISLPILRLWDLPVFSSGNFAVFLSYLSLSISKIFFSYRYLIASLKELIFPLQLLMQYPCCGLGGPIIVGILEFFAIPLNYLSLLAQLHNCQVLILILIIIYDLWGAREHLASLSESLRKDNSRLKHFEKAHRPRVKVSILGR